MNWNDVTREEAMRLFNDGLSATEIAQQLGDGATRGAVIGMIDRARKNGADLRQGRPARRRVLVLETPKTRTHPKPPRIVAPVLTAPPARLKEDGSRVGMADLEMRDCKWPHGLVGTAGFHFCANEKAKGSVYCPYHTAFARRPHKTPAT